MQILLKVILLLFCLLLLEVELFEQCATCCNYIKRGGVYILTVQFPFYLF